MNELVTILRMPGRAAPGALPAIGDISAYGALIADARSPATARARRQDMADLARYLGIDGGPAAAALVVAGTAGQANAVALGYVGRMVRMGLAPATVNRRVSSVRRLVRLARRLGLIDWTLDVDSIASQPYRSTAGPGHEGWLAILAAAKAAAAAGSPIGLRDLAIIRLLHDAGLRRGELAAIDLADLDAGGRCVWIVGKGGHGERRRWTYNRPTAAALEGWIRARGGAPGPLFVRLDRGAGTLERLSADGVHELVRALGRRAGLAAPARPHGLRHQATTRLLELTNGDVRQVRYFTRHRKIDTVCIYDDARSDVAGAMGGLLGEDAP